MLQRYNNNPYDTGISHLISQCNNRFCKKNEHKELTNIHFEWTKIIISYNKKTITCSKSSYNIILYASFLSFYALSRVGINMTNRSIYLKVKLKTNYNSFLNKTLTIRTEKIYVSPTFLFRIVIVQLIQKYKKRCQYLVFRYFMDFLINLFFILCLGSTISLLSLYNSYLHHFNIAAILALTLIKNWHKNISSAAQQLSVVFL